MDEDFSRDRHRSALKCAKRADGGENVTKSAKSNNDVPQETSIPGAVPLEALLLTEELRNRPSRPPQYEGENRALVALARALADSRKPFCKRWLMKSSRSCMPTRLA